MRVLWITNVPSPYRVDFFNELGLFCDLTVLFEKRTSDERDESWLHYKFNEFKGIFLNGVKVSADGAICFDILKYIKKEKYDIVVVSDFTSPTGMLAIEYMRLRGISYWLESDGGFAKTGKGIKELIKRHFIKGANLYLSTGTLHDEYYIKYGAEKEKIMRYPFSSIKETDIIERPICSEEKKILREKLGIKEAKIILAVGQFIPRKGFDLLLRASVDLKQDIGLYFVGGQASTEYKNYVSEHQMQNIHFVGFKSKQEISEYYMAADFFVLPTREDIWGLVINEAMAYGLPVITTDMCIAGMELITEHENGYIVESENVNALRGKIEELLRNDDLIHAMSCNAIQTAQKYTIETMVQRHVELFEQRL